MRKVAAWLLIISIYSGVTAPSTQVQGQYLGKTMQQKQQNAPPGLTFRLSEGVQGAEQRAKQILADSQVISESQAARDVVPHFGAPTMKKLG